MMDGEYVQNPFDVHIPKHGEGAVTFSECISDPAS